MGFYPPTQTVLANPARPIIEWEECDCLLCGGREYVPIIEGADRQRGGTGYWFVVVQCQECGLCFTNPRPSLASMSQFYRPDPLAHRARSVRTTRLTGKRGWLHSPRERHELPRHGDGRLLDLGCGTGTFLERMHGQGWQVTGLDVSPGVVEQVNRDLGLCALVGTLPHPDLQAGDFDVITMWQALEHVHYPLEVLREAHRLLSPGGKVLVAVPNIDSQPFRWFGSSWYALDLPRHLTHFAPMTLQRMLEQAGFQCGPVRMVGHTQWLRSSASLARRDRQRPHWYRWLKAKPVARLATWYSYLTRQADCMMVTAVKA